MVTFSHITALGGKLTCVLREAGWPPRLLSLHERELVLFDHPWIVDRYFTITNNVVPPSEEDGRFFGRAIPGRAKGVLALHSWLGIHNAERRSEITGWRKQSAERHFLVEEIEGRRKD